MSRFAGASDHRKTIADVASAPGMESRGLLSRALRRALRRSRDAAPSYRDRPPPPRAPKGVLRRFYEAVSAGNLDALDELMSDDMVEHEQLPGLEPTKEGVKQFFAIYRSAFPDLRMEAHELLAEGDLRLRSRHLDRNAARRTGVTPSPAWTLRSLREWLRRQRPVAFI
jgi:SnoaL-like domain